MIDRNALQAALVEVCDSFGLHMMITTYRDEDSLVTIGGADNTVDLAAMNILVDGIKKVSEELEGEVMEAGKRAYDKLVAESN